MMITATVFTSSDAKTVVVTDTDGRAQEHKYSRKMTCARAAILSLVAFLELDEDEIDSTDVYGKRAGVGSIVYYLDTDAWARNEPPNGSQQLGFVSTSVHEAHSTSA